MTLYAPKRKSYESTTSDWHYKTLPVMTKAWRKYSTRGYLQNGCVVLGNFVGGKRARFWQNSILD